MYGLGILKGMWLVFRHGVEAYWEDIRWLGKRYSSSRALKERQGPKARGAFTVMYPEEKLPVPEEFRFLPFLVYDEGPAGEQNLRCTSCGICSKVCPAQCIWIERTTDAHTGRPVPEPLRFHIDIDVCMNCGLCAEYCPFDAIKMDHDYEVASYNRMAAHIYDKKKLAKPAAYYAQIRPINAAREDAARASKETKKAAK
jgi:NADH-quinone oxidoreductase subunit I